MIAGWAISDQKLERPAKAMNVWAAFCNVFISIRCHDLCEWRVEGGREKEDEDTKPCVYGLSMTICNDLIHELRF